MAFPILGTPKPQFLDSTGAPASGGSISVLDPTTDAEKASYPTADDADAATNANTNPITLNERGEPPTGLWGLDNTAYKLIVTDSDGATLYFIDDLRTGIHTASAYTNTATGAVATTLQAKLDGLVLDLKADFGAVGDNSTNDTAAILAWLTEINATGRKGYAPKGTYLTDTHALTTLSNDIEIECARGAIFKYRTGESEPLFSFSHSAIDTYGLTWKGGIIDNSGGVSVASAQSNTCLELQLLTRVNISGLYCLGESTYDAANTVTTGTDSGITTVNCRDVTIHDCVFLGQGDGGVYLSGGALTATSDDGGRTLIYDNFFSQCWQGVVMKRDVNMGVIHDNFFRECRTGIVATESDSVDPAQQHVIHDNYFKKIETRAIEVRANDNWHVHDNVVEDWGIKVDETLSGTPYAFMISGSDKCHFHDNKVYMVDWITFPTGTAGVGIHGLYINEPTINTVTYTPSNNIVNDNSFANCEFGITETTASSNRYRDNIFTTVTTPYNSMDSTAKIIHSMDGVRSITDVTTVGNVDAGTDDLITEDIPANYFIASVKRAVRITA